MIPSSGNKPGKFRFSLFFIFYCDRAAKALPLKYIFRVKDNL